MFFVLHNALNTSSIDRIKISSMFAVSAECMYRGLCLFYIIAKTISGQVIIMTKEVLINKEISKVTYYYVLILNLNLKCIINFLKVISISKEYFI